ncbi:hypothetical protein CHU98_g6184 [Xylaria longipes]|nr:hypothetical protein CHU98_g6184 [Xylaria longipes]
MRWLQRMMSRDATPYVVRLKGARRDTDPRPLSRFGNILHTGLQPPLLLRRKLLARFALPSHHRATFSSSGPTGNKATPWAASSQSPVAAEGGEEEEENTRMR